MGQERVLLQTLASKVKVLPASWLGKARQGWQEEIGQARLGGKEVKQGLVVSGRAGVAARQEVQTCQEGPRSPMR